MASRRLAAGLTLATGLTLALAAVAPTHANEPATAQAQPLVLKPHREQEHKSRLRIVMFQMLSLKKWKKIRWKTIRSN